AIEGLARQVMEAARGGICVPPGNSRAIAEAVLWLKSHSPEALSMGRQARAHVQLYFNRRVHAFQFVGLIEWLVRPGNDRSQQTEGDKYRSMSARPAGASIPSSKTLFFELINPRHLRANESLADPKTGAGFGPRRTS